MPVPNTMADLSQTAGSNYPVGSEPIGNNLDNYLRSHAAIIKSTNSVASASIAAGSTVNVANANGEHVQITGTATISSLGAGFIGCKRELRFAGACTLTHSSSLQLPKAQNITVAAGEVLHFRCIGLGAWICTGGTYVAPLTVADIPSLPASKITSGTLDASRIPNLEASKITSGVFNDARIPNLNASKITAGILPVAQGGTGLNTLGAAVYLRTNAAGTAIGFMTKSEVLSDIGAFSSSGGSLPGDLDVLKTNAVVGVGAGSRNGGLANYGTDGSGQVGVFSNHAGGQIFLRPNGRSSSAGQAVVNSSGDMAVSGVLTAVDVSATSDERLKNNIRATYGRRELIEVLRLCRYEWQADGRSAVGVIAQEVQKLAPEYVHEGEDGMLSVDKASLALEAVMALAELQGVR